MYWSDDHIDDKIAVTGNTIFINIANINVYIYIYMYVYIYIERERKRNAGIYFGKKDIYRQYINIICVFLAYVNGNSIPK